MSRRSRRKASSRASKTKGRSLRWGRWLGGIAVLGVIGLFLGYGWLRGWLHSEGFRVMLEKEAGRALGVVANFGSFRWEGTQVSTSSFRAEGQEAVRMVEAEGISLDIGLGRVRERVVEVRDARIARLEVEIDPRRPKVSLPEAPPQDPAVPKAKGHWYDRFLPREAELTGLEIGQSVIHTQLGGGTLAFEGTSWSVQPAQVKGAYEARGNGGVVTTPWKRVPPLRLGEARIRYQDSRIFLTHADFRLFERGALTLTGEAGLGDGNYAFDGRLVDVDAAEVIPEDWKQRLQGGVESEFGVMNGPKGPVVDGNLQLTRGILTGLPILEALGAYGDNQRFLRLTLSEASTRFLWEDGVLRLDDFILASEGLMRVEGRLMVTAEERLDGRFRVGLTPGTLSRIPGAETKVFQPGERGLLWTDVRITGTVDDPEEDLTSRLLMAAGIRMLETLPETGEQVLKYSGRALNPETLREITGKDGIIGQGADLIERGKNLIDGGSDGLDDVGGIIRDGTDIIERGKGIFDILGGDDEKAQEPPPAPEESGKPQE
ncbi:MAG: AsmA-like C-terminal region-containing protein [Akkermansiaceae bacterium]|nr:AsmA-like C-terminal region-containing protein [Akkermansiaceae bacterium]